ncbi:FadR/GntR family transcriptional regulator [Dietzia sp. PP-33]|uniref:FadR/GntR family transcriptional regulator n=1 Tax=Dietzia sp. PP-33 TaxID=2957500 RepID=UPI0029B85865|nr:FadR/GntR family transcriptional regulator [Dietzia sp. PP-33]MDX2358984.1 FadR family transcriptional regulator [Dietzia sp. PP-33]
MDVTNRRILAAHEAVREQIAVRVSDGVYRVGQALPSERELAEEFAVSRSTVRQALSSLQMIGLVVARPGSGVYVNDGLPDDSIQRFSHVLFGGDPAPRDIMEARALLEPQIAALAAARRTDEDLRALKVAMQGVTQADGALDGMRTIEHGFHRRLAASVGNGVISGLLRPLLIGPESLAHLVEQAHKHEKFDHDHQLIYNAVRRQDAELARELMAQHLSRLFDLV